MKFSIYTCTWLDGGIQVYAAKLPYYTESLFHLETKLHQRENVGGGKEGCSLPVICFSVFVM